MANNDYRKFNADVSAIVQKNKDIPYMVRGNVLLEHALQCMDNSKKSIGEAAVIDEEEWIIICTAIYRQNYRILKDKRDADEAR